MAKRKSNRRQRTIDQRFVKSLAHELRAEILMILTEQMASPNELSRMLDEGLSQVSYHVKVLKDYGRIKLVKTEPRRGAVEHFYRATSDTLLPAKVWRKAKGLRTVIGGGLASDLFDDLADAVGAQKLTEEDSHIHRISLFLDAKGLENVSAIVERATEDVEKEQRESSSRVTKVKGKVVEVTAYTLGVLAFKDCREVTNGALQGKNAKAASANGRSAKTKRTNGSKKRGKAANAKRTAGKKKGTAMSASGGKRKAKTVGQ
jgi:DNA-binding transcriptional ArsR family regulator